MLQLKVLGLTADFANQSFDLITILQQAKVAAGSTDLSDVRIKLQQYDNYSAVTDGREFDNIQVTATVSGPEIDILGNSQVILDGDTTPTTAVTQNFYLSGTGTGTLYHKIIGIFIAVVIGDKYSCRFESGAARSKLYLERRCSTTGAYRCSGLCNNNKVAAAG